MLFAGCGWWRQFLPPALFFLGAWSVAGHSWGEAFIDPATRLQLAAHGRVADVACVLGEIRAYEVDCPARLKRAAVAGTLGSQVLKLGGDLLACGGRPSGVRGVLKPWESSRLVGFEPGAYGMFMAV